MEAMTGSDKPVCTIQLSRTLRIRRQTIIDMIAELRRVMWRPDEAKLSGVVQIDTLKLPSRHGAAAREDDEIVGIFIAVEVNNGRPGNVVLRAVKDFEYMTIQNCLLALVDIGSTIEVQERDQGSAVRYLGYENQVVHRMTAPGTDGLPACKVVAELARLWFDAVFHAGMARKDLAPYLAECAFRVNYALEKSTRSMFDGLLTLAVLDPKHRVDRSCV
jgi:hypothetical protein